MQIEVSQIPHRYRNRFLRDYSGSVTVNKNSTSNSAASNSFYPVNIWGQYFDDTEDINGDFNTHGSVFAENSLNASTLNITNDSSLHYVVTENIEPRQTNLYSLGSAAKQWKKIFVSAIDCQDAGTQNLSADNASVGKMYVDTSLFVGGEEINVTELYSELQALRDLILDVSSRVPIQSSNQ